MPAVRRYRDFHPGPDGKLRRVKGGATFRERELGQDRPADRQRVCKRFRLSRCQERAALDVAALTARLRDTQAIGVFTKLALKNQMDDLLKQFRAHYQSGQKTSVASLRQPYDMLVLKVLSVVQDGDPSLARTISGSREAIWSILADREKFNSAT